MTQSIISDLGLSASNNHHQNNPILGLLLFLFLLFKIALHAIIDIMPSCGVFLCVSCTQGNIKSVSQVMCGPQPYTNRPIVSAMNQEKQFVHSAYYHSMFLEWYTGKPPYPLPVTGTKGLLPHSSPTRWRVELDREMADLFFFRTVLGLKPNKSIIDPNLCVGLLQNSSKLEQDFRHFLDRRSGVVPST